MSRPISASIDAPITAGISAWPSIQVQPHRMPSATLPPLLAHQPGQVAPRESCSTGVPGSVTGRTRMRAEQYLLVRDISTRFSGRTATVRQAARPGATSQPAQKVRRSFPVRMKSADNSPEDHHDATTQRGPARFARGRDRGPRPAPVQAADDHDHGRRGRGDRGGWRGGRAARRRHRQQLAREFGAARQR